MSSSGGTFICVQFTTCPWYNISLDPWDLLSTFWLSVSFKTLEELEGDKKGRLEMLIMVSFGSER